MTRPPMRPTITLWWIAVAPALNAVHEACRTNSRPATVAAARAAMTAIGREPVPVGEERTVSELFGVCALIASTWRDGDQAQCGDVYRMLGRTIAGLREPVG